MYKLSLVTLITTFLSVACGVKAIPDSEVEQHQASSIRKVAPQGAAVQPTVLSTLVIDKVTITIMNADQIAANIQNGSVTVAFNVSGQGSSTITLLCRTGVVPDVWRMPYHVCNGSSGSSETISKIQAGASYGIGVVAQDGSNGSTSREVSAIFTAGQNTVASAD